LDLLRGTPALDASLAVCIIIRQRPSSEGGILRVAQNGNIIEKRLWDAADELRANSKLKSSEYSTPVLGLIFLRYADFKFTLAEKEINASRPANSRRTIGKTDYHARGVLYRFPICLCSGRLRGCWRRMTS